LCQEDGCQSPQACNVNVHDQGHLHVGDGSMAREAYTPGVLRSHRLEGNRRVIHAVVRRNEQERQVEVTVETKHTRQRKAYVSDICRKRWDSILPSRRVGRRTNSSSNAPFSSERDGDTRYVVRPRFPTISSGAGPEDLRRRALKLPFSSTNVQHSTRNSCWHRKASETLCCGGWTGGLAR
jgi:hypothetical protein